MPPMTVVGRYERFQLSEEGTLKLVRVLRSWCEQLKALRLSSEMCPGYVPAI